MIVEVKGKPTKAIKNNKEWFPIYDTGKMISLFGDSAYMRILNEKEYILVEPTTADEFNMEEHELLMELESKKDWTQEEYDEIVKDYNHSAEVISDRDPGDEHKEQNGERRKNNRRGAEMLHLFGRRKYGDRRK